MLCCYKGSLLEITVRGKELAFWPQIRELIPIDRVTTLDDGGRFAETVTPHDYRPWLRPLDVLEGEEFEAAGLLALLNLKARRDFKLEGDQARELLLFVYRHGLRSNNVVRDPVADFATVDLAHKDPFLNKLSAEFSNANRMLKLYPHYYTGRIMGEQQYNIRPLRSAMLFARIQVEVISNLPRTQLRQTRKVYHRPKNRDHRRNY